jgi:hypothetical protein
MKNVVIALMLITLTVVTARRSGSGTYLEGVVSIVSQKKLSRMVRIKLCYNKNNNNNNNHN